MENRARTRPGISTLIEIIKYLIDNLIDDIDLLERQKKDLVSELKVLVPFHVEWQCENNIVPLMRADDTALLCLDKGGNIINHISRSDLASVGNDHLKPHEYRQYFEYERDCDALLNAIDASLECRTIKRTKFVTVQDGKRYHWENIIIPCGENCVRYYCCRKDHPPPNILKNQ